MKNGKVKFFNDSKGFGFIISEKQEIFVHQSGLIDAVNENDNVEFELQQGKKGIIAVKVKKIK